MLKLPRDFVLNFALYEQMLRDDGEKQEGIDEIKQAIRDHWHDPELRQLWIEFINYEADFMRGIQAMAKGITERIKTSIKTTSQEQSHEQ